MRYLAGGMKLTGGSLTDTCPSGAEWGLLEVLDVGWTRQVGIQCPEELIYMSLLPCFMITHGIPFGEKQEPICVFDAPE
jgi:hypothetical protein